LSRTSAETATQPPTLEETPRTPDSLQLLNVLPNPLPAHQAEGQAALLAPATTRPPTPRRAPGIPAFDGEGDGSPIEHTPEDVAVGESEASATLPTPPLDVQVPPPTEVGDDSLSISSPPQDAGSGSPIHTPTWAGDVEVYPPLMFKITVRAVRLLHKRTQPKIRHLGCLRYDERTLKFPWPTMNGTKNEQSWSAKLKIGNAFLRRGHTSLQDRQRPLKEERL
jgi:hypothetical protein